MNTIGHSMLGNKMRKLALLLSSITLMISCSQEQTKDTKQSPPTVTNIIVPKDTTSTTTVSVKDTSSIVQQAKETSSSEVDKTTTVNVNTKPSKQKYSWMANYAPNTSLENQIPTPEGYRRITQDIASFGTWLRGLPLLPKTSKVMLFNGQEKPYQDGAYRILDIDIGSRDLQQCADAVMRLVAEYHYSNENYPAIHFNYTSGHTIRFSDWSKGKKPVIKGSKVSFTVPKNQTNTSYKNFKKYLTNVYCYAGTASLAKELVSKEIHKIAPGDVFIWGGFPGHAVLVIDVAEHRETGKRIFLLAQSYMPAQNIHILRNFNASELSPWYSEDFGAQLLTPEWTFERNSLKTFK